MSVINYGSGVVTNNSYFNVQEQNSVIRKWISMVQKRLRITTQSLSHGKKGSSIHHGRSESKLSLSIKSQTRQDYGVIDRASILFERHGVFVHKGVGKGYQMIGGTVVRSAKSTNPLTMREPKDWFNPVIAQALPELIQKLEKINADAVVNATSLKIK
jgi:hypothetical protein